jgi:glutamyl/glutaminyl-tRNA synthetase
MREHLNEAAERRVAVLDPLKLIITNYPEGQTEECFAPNHPLKPELGKRAMPFGRELWIEREDFMEEPSKGYHRLYPGNMARLRYGYVVKCTGCEKDADGKVTAVLCEYLPETPSPARRAPTASRSRATCTGSRSPTPTPPRSASTTACSVPPRAPAAKAMRRGWSATSSTTSTRQSKTLITAQLEAGAQGRQTGRALPVRTPRLLRRRPDSTVAAGWRETR